MMVMTAKVDFKKIMLILLAVAAVIVALILLFGGDSRETAVQTVATNDGRVQFLLRICLRSLFLLFLKMVDLIKF